MTINQARALIQKVLQAWIDELISADNESYVCFAVQGTKEKG